MISGKFGNVFIRHPLQQPPSGGALHWKMKVPDHSLSRRLYLQTSSQYLKGRLGYILGTYSLIPRPHSHVSFPGFIPMSHSQASFPCHIPRPHSHVTFPGLVPMSHSQASFPCHIPRPHSHVTFPGLVPMSHSQASPPQYPQPQDTESLGGKDWDQRSLPR